MRAPVAFEVGQEFTAGLSFQIVTPDLVEAYEASADEQRHPALIEIADMVAERRVQVSEGRVLINHRLIAISKARGVDSQAMQMTNHGRFVSARLARQELEVLRSEFSALHIHRIWRNGEKRALIARSAITIQVAPAHEAYSALGQSIEWATLDTGIHHRHPHFATHCNIASLWDCTQASSPGTHGEVNEPVGGFVEWNKGVPTFPANADAMLDRNGHGTHVAGIIAGNSPRAYEIDGEALSFSGMAPKARLHVFKVLGNNGNGEDASIIIALDKIAAINEAAGDLRIHGINLSLGGSFDPSIYGCGHTPLCAELRRLWRQGVLIVLAAGNEGFIVLKSEDGGSWQTNMDLSIGDPANLDEAIAVGSVHKTNPHTFGISYFSSRGPTADGRKKPDLVAPGEKIISARAGFEQELARVAASKSKKGQRPKQLDPAQGTLDQLYVALSGTSMAAPHVSGILAAFLSRRREFIGYPDQVKQFLLDTCTNLNRDEYAQGRGMPNLMKMLASA